MHWFFTLVGALVQTSINSLVPWVEPFPTNEAPVLSRSVVFLYFNPPLSA